MRVLFKEHLAGLGLEMALNLGRLGFFSARRIGKK